MADANYDLAIIGGGPGGYAAALRAAELNLKVAVIEKDKVGGTCLHRGCIPTTSLLECAQVLETVHKAGQFGITVEGASYDWAGMQKAKSSAVNRLFAGLKTLLKQRKVEIINGTATFNEPGLIEVQTDSGTSTVAAPNIIIATGSMPQSIPALPNHDIAMDTTQALEIGEVPKSITIVGGGAYGVEFASLFRSLGSEVFLIELSPRLVPRDDRDISKYLERAFKKRGINMHTSSKVEAAVVVDGKIEVELSKNDQGETITSDKLLVTAGRIANLDSIDVDSLGIDTRDGFIKTGPDMKTSADGIYAVGDVTFNPQYANFAFQEGIHAVETIAGINPHPLNLRQIPIYTFGYPQLAKVGYSEDEAKEAGFDIETVGLPFQLISRSAIDKEDIGFAKMISVKGGPIIGVHLLGPDVVDLIPEAMLITNWEATAEDVAQFLHPHPTFTEAIGEAVLKLAGKPLHSL